MKTRGTAVPGALQNVRPRTFESETTGVETFLEELYRHKPATAAFLYTTW